jgi:hypothetical protein
MPMKCIAEMPSPMTTLAAAVSRVVSRSRLTTTSARPAAATAATNETSTVAMS